MLYFTLGKSGETSDLVKQNSLLSGLEAHVTPSEHKKPLICGKLSTSLHQIIGAQTLS
jgi:hypothetical protein